jgi:hypothetical protein
MAKYVMTNTKVTINGTDFSSALNSVELALSADEVDTTNFGGSGWKGNAAGLKSASVTLNWMQDFGAGSVNAILQPLFGSNATVVCIPTSTAVSATNPSWSGEFVVSQYSPIAGAVGDLAVFSTTWNSNGVITYATA